MQQPHERRRSGYRPWTSTPAHQSYRQPPSPGQRIDSRRVPRHVQVGSSSGGQDIKLVTNAYNITANGNFRIYEYELFVEPSSSCRDLPAEVLSRAYVSKSIRQIIMSDLVPGLSEVRVPHGSIIIGSNLEAIYSLHPFVASSQTQQGLRFSNVIVSTDLINHLSVDIFIRFKRTLTSDTMSDNGSLLSSIIHHQLMIAMMRYGSVYYSLGDSMMFGASRRTHQRLDLISNHLIGIAISGARQSDDSKTMVVINSSHSYITNSYRLIDLLASFLAERPVDRVEPHHHPHLAIIQGNEEWFGSFCSILNGYKCRAKESNGMYVNLRFNLTQEPASHLRMDGVISVQDFYMRMGIAIHYPNLPCLKSRSPVHPYHPLELCSLLSGQKVPIFRLSTAARNHLILMNKPHPNTSKTASVKARDEIAHINRSQFDAFSMQLSRDPVRASGYTLSKPILQYRDQTIDPRRDFWESSTFYRPIELVDNWCVVDTVGIDENALMSFLRNFSDYAGKLGLQIGAPLLHLKPKQEILDERDSIETLIRKYSSLTKRSLRFVLFVIDSTSTQLNRMIHLAFDENPNVSATCLRSESVLNERQQRSIFRTLVHKLNARLGGTNHTYHSETMDRLCLDSSDLMIVGLDVTHPDNELNGVSIVGCAFTISKDLFKHKALVWPQAARKEIITRMDALVQRLLDEYSRENSGQLPRQIIIYRDGVSDEEFERVRVLEIAKAQRVIEDASKVTKQAKPNLSYIIAQKRHALRFFQETNSGVQNPAGGTLINKGIVSHEGREFYLFSNTSPQATARPLHYHVILNGLGLENLQKLTYYLCFNFGKCSSSLSMPSTLRYAHNAAYDARNRVIASKEFSENMFYTTKFFC